ncbi:HAD family phosphatase [Amnibacterium sp. CER49]|uniref:HAD family hydrolase n=1 Tax=Amnibacterium sp. CER49 TaxID=3039161 RepID=UPI00244B5800|nr:HAD family phosphatase [Amnibacterium sp. CER49]MDH2444085.1 HAD family phosphatase [Amnibacterium sp. CER49]
MPESGPDGVLVVFDCDGVLVETEAVDARVQQQAFAELGVDLTVEEIAERFAGGTGEHFAAELARVLGSALDFDWHERFGDRYTRAYERELTSVPGVEGVLDALDRLDVDRCVASNSTPDHLHAVLSLTGLLPRFAGRMFSAIEVARGKPAPDLFLHAAATLGYPPERCVVVEDSVAGVTAARAAGMAVLGYVGGLTPRARLEPLATEVFTDMTALPVLLGRYGVGAQPARR